MRSYTSKIDPRRRIFVRLLTAVYGEIERALAESEKDHKLSRAEIARRLGINRSVLTRRLNGTQNMTLETVADMAWALERDIIPPRLVKTAASSNRPLYSPDESANNNAVIIHAGIGGTATASASTTYQCIVRS